MFTRLTIYEALVTSASAASTRLPVLVLSRPDHEMPMLPKSQGAVSPRSKHNVCSNVLRLVEKRDQMHHDLRMIKSFQHKGLKLFYETGSTRGIRADHAKRLARALHFLDRATSPGDVDIPGWRLHPLKGDLTQYWSITISGSWRVIFRFDDSDVELINYLDYH